MPVNHRSLLLSVLLVFAAAPAFAQDAADLPLDALLRTEIRTAAKYAQLASQAPASVTIITAEDIARYRYRTLDQLLGTVRGLYISNDRNYSYLGIRGFSRPTDFNDRILLLVNGHVLNENVFGSAPVGTDLVLDLRAIERVEIVRGPGAALYGTGAMFAIVNIILKTAKSVDGLSAYAAAGTGRLLSAAVVAGREREEGAFLSSVLWRDDQGEDLYFSEYDDGSPFAGMARGLDDDRSAGAIATWQRGGLSLTSYAATRTKGVPTGAYDVDFGSPESETTDQRAFVDLQYEQDLSAATTLTARVFADYYFYEGFYPYDGFVSRDMARGVWGGADVQLQWDRASNHRLTGGVELVRNQQALYEVDDPSAATYSHDESFGLASVYLQSEYQLSSRLSFTAGLRHDHYSHVGNATSPRLALVYHPRPDATVKLLHGTAFRTPNVYELYYVDPFGGLQGNPSLGAERIRTSELVYQQRLGGNVVGELSAYDYAIDRLVDPIENASSGVLRYENIGEVKARGFEAGLQSRAQRGIWTYVNYGLQRTRDASDEALTNSPRQLVRAGVSAPLGRSWDAAVETAWESARRTVYGTTTDPFVLVNGVVSWKPASRPFRLNLIVRNLLDTDYATPGGFEHRQPAIRQPGVAATLELEYSF